MKRFLGSHFFPILTSYCKSFPSYPAVFVHLDEAKDASAVISKNSNSSAVFKTSEATKNSSVDDQIDDKNMIEETRRAGISPPKKLSITKILSINSHRNF